MSRCVPRKTPCSWQWVLIHTRQGNGRRRHKRRQDKRRQALQRPLPGTGWWSSRTARRASTTPAWSPECSTSSSVVHTARTGARAAARSPSHTSVCAASWRYSSVQDRGAWDISFRVERRGAGAACGVTGRSADLRRRRGHTAVRASVEDLAALVQPGKQRPRLRVLRDLLNPAKQGDVGAVDIAPPVFGRVWCLHGHGGSPFWGNRRPPGAERRGSLAQPAASRGRFATINVGRVSSRR